MKKVFTKNTLLILFATLFFTMSSCLSIKGLFSEGQDEIKKANDLWSQGKQLEALIHATQAVITDPVFIQGKSYVKDYFDEGIKNAQETILRYQSPSNSEEAEKKYDIYNNLVKIYTNLEQIELPLEHPKGKWSWTTKMVNYKPQLYEAKQIAFTLLMKEAREALKAKDVPTAQKKFLNASRNYTDQADSVKNLVAGELCDFAVQFSKSTVIEEAILSYNAYKSALKFVPSYTIALEGTKNMALYISQLYNKQGLALEGKGDVDSMVASITEFDNALKWQKNNAEAQQNKDRVTAKIAEYYYQKGLQAEKSKNKTEATEMFESVRKWIPDYKDSMQRLYTNRIGDKIEEMAQNLSVTRTEHNKLKSKIGGLSKNVDKSVEVMGKVTYISDKTKSFNTTMKTTESTLRVFSIIPTVGVVTTTLARTVNMAQKPIGSMDEKFTRIEKPVITPTKKVVEKTQVVVNKTKTTMEKTDAVIKTTEAYTLKFSDCAAQVIEERKFKEAEKAIDEINKGLVKTNKSLADVNQGFSKVDNGIKSIANISGTVNKVENGMKDVAQVLDKIGPIVNDLKSALQKKFTLNLGFKKFTFSVEKILTGMPKEVKMIMGAFEDLAMKALNPILKQFNIKIPSIPGYSDLSKQLDNMKGYYDSINSEYNSINKAVNDFANHQNHIENNLQKLQSSLGCNILE